MVGPVRCPKCGREVVPRKDASGKLVCPLCRNTGKVQDEQAAAVVVTSAPRAKTAPKRRGILLPVLLVGLLVVGAATALLLLWGGSDDASGASPEAAGNSETAGAKASDLVGFATSPYLLGGHDYATLRFDLANATEVLYEVESADGRPVEAMFASDAEMSALLAGEAVEGNASMVDAINPSGSATLAAGRHHFLLICKSWGSCRGNLTLLVAAEVEAPTAGPAPRPKVEATILDGSAKATEGVLPLGYRYVVFEVRGQTTVEYVARETHGFEVAAFIMELADTPLVNTGELATWADTQGAGTIANGTTLEAGEYILAVRCQDEARDCEVAITFRAVMVDGVSRPRLLPFDVRSSGTGARVQAGGRLVAETMTLVGDRLVRFLAFADDGLQARLILVPVASYAGHEEDAQYEDAVAVTFDGQGTAIWIVPAGEWQVLVECASPVPCEITYNLGYWSAD